MRRWADGQAPARHAQSRCCRLPGRTPLLFIDVPGQVDDCVLLYGHLDKQPEFTGWSDGLDPWTPVIRDGKLYGRGGADDGYALFALADGASGRCTNRGIPHARCVDPDRGQRGKRQPRPRAARRGPRRPPRHAEPGRLPRCRMRQLRPAVVHDLAARQPDRHAARRRADAKACTPGSASGIVPSSFRVIARAAGAGRGRELRRHPASRN